MEEDLSFYQIVRRYLVYWARMIRFAAIGSRGYYLWMALLAVILGIGIISWYHHLTEGLIVTNMSDHVSWGIGIANFVYFVGVAAGAAVLVVPAYAYTRSDIKEIVLLGELLAVCAVTMCLMFIMSDVGRPERLWHLMPMLGKMNLPRSLLAWDVVVFSGYLLLNLHIPGYLLYKTYLGQKPNKLAYLPFVFLSMAWAISIHTVTAFLLSGLGSRPFWNTPILAPRFLISAGASGPALLVFMMRAVQRYTKLEVRESVFDYFKYLLRIMMPINLFLLGCEVFEEFYTGSQHSASAHYLYFGLHGHNMLSKFIWTATIFNITATVIFLVPKLRENSRVFYAGCLLAISGIWIEKGMGLIFPGFIPSPLGEIVEYRPNATEIFVNLGIVAFGAMLLTVLTRITVAIQTGELRVREGAAPPVSTPEPAE